MLPSEVSRAYRPSARFLPAKTRLVLVALTVLSLGIPSVLGPTLIVDMGHRPPNLRTADLTRPQVTEKGFTRNAGQLANPEIRFYAISASRGWCSPLQILPSASGSPRRRMTPTDGRIWMRQSSRGGGRPSCACCSRVQARSIPLVGTSCESDSTSSLDATLFRGGPMSRAMLGWSTGSCTLE